MCFPEFAEEGVDLVFDKMMEMNQLENNLFTFLYYPDEKRADIQFGLINDTVHEGNMIWLPVSKHEHWTVLLKDLIINGER